MTLATQPSLIETMKADADALITLLPGHLRRLERSAQALGYVYPGREAVVSAIRAALEKTDTHGQTARRVRLLLNPDGQLSVETGALPALQGTPLIALSSLRLDSDEPFLQHKTTHRPWYDATTQWLVSHPVFFDLIYLNEKGELCEGSRSNIYILKNGEWLTPPLSCGLLGGVLRTHLLETGQAKEAILTPLDFTADKASIRLSNALRGWFDVQLDPSILPGRFLP